MNEFKNLGNVGWYRDASNLITFQLGESVPLSESTGTGVIDISQFQQILQPIVLNIKDKYILLKGSNNRLPDEIASVVGSNRILPELIEKQTRILYGKGPRVYTESFVGGKLIRNWQKNDVIEGWMDSWQDNGLQDNIKDYCEKVIHDYYYFEDYWNKWRFYRSRREAMEQSVAGLEHIDNKRCRLATNKNINTYGWDIEDRDFNDVVVGNWAVAMEKLFGIYPRFRMSQPFGNAVAISYHRNHSVGQIYGFNRFYAGIKDWLTGTNRNPKYINSYLENSLNAKVHVIIPYQWIENVETKLQQYCNENAKLQDAGKELIKPNNIDIGTEYSVVVRDKYIAKELESLSSFLSGVSNQGKMYASYSFPTSDGKDVAWQVIPLDLKYREFITALLEYDKRADEVILSSIGIDASISNISKDGVISKSGSDLYYNYMIYLYNLPLAEETCTEALNQAIKINFPKLYLQGFRIGFYNEVPSRQEDVSPGDRLQNTFNRSLEKLHGEIKRIESKVDKIKPES